MDTGGIVQLEWQCPSCTLINRGSSFKCRVCGTPKGTSTRQSKFHTAALEQQYLAESLHRLQIAKGFNKAMPVHPPPSSGGGPSTSGKRRSRLKTASGKSEINKNKKTISSSYRRWPTIDNIDRTSGHSYTVTVNSVSVVITEYMLLYPGLD